MVAGQRASFTGTDQLDHEIAQIPNRDDFDSFASQRDQREDHAESSNYISPEMTGASDLDEYGHWRYVADYGPVWTPAAVAPGWAPYRYGHWVWVAPWGWTWVEDEPWGFAPFHYGRWAFVESSWCWVPGPVVVRPVYAPALVAFVGGGGFGVGVGVGVAWFPLAPREVYVPWYRTSPGYVNNVNVTNTRVSVTQVTNVYNTTIINNNTTNVTRINYANQRVTNAVTAVNHETFVNARPVAASMVKVDQRTDRECSRHSHGCGTAGACKRYGSRSTRCRETVGYSDEPASCGSQTAARSARFLRTAAGRCAERSQRDTRSSATYDSSGK